MKQFEYELARQLSPDVIIMGVSMPGMGGVEATRRIKAEVPEVKVIGLSMFDDEAIAQNMYQVGVDGYITSNLKKSNSLWRRCEALQNAHILRICSAFSSPHACQRA